MPVGPGAVFVHGAITVDVGDADAIVVLAPGNGVVPTVAGLLVVFGVVPGCTPVDPVAVPAAPGAVPVVPVAAPGVLVDVPVVPTADGDVDVVVPPPTLVLGARGVRPSPTIAGFAGDLLPLMDAVVEAAPGVVPTPAVAAGRHGSGLPFGTGAPGCRLPDCGAVVVAGAPGVLPVADVEGDVLCASRETMSAAVSRAAAPVVLAILIFT
jgi:hypothetical protein